MRCPECQSETLPERFRCAVCRAEFKTCDAEELEHLAYLQTWLRQSYDDRVLSGRLLDALLDRTHQRTAALTAPQEREAPRITVAPVATAPRPAPPETHPAPPRPAPSVSRPPIGAYLGSERSLHALLALGAFLILASGVVISLFNPTSLGPLLHVAAVLCTTVLFYVAGYLVRQRVHLALTGTALLAIGGAFIPLCLWTFGQEFLSWQPATVWLLASTLSLPIYVASHNVLRDRTSAVLVALAGGSALLSLGNWLGVPLEWGCVGLIALACGYLWAAHRLDVARPTLAWGLAWTAQMTVPCLMLVLLGARFFPAAWQSGAQTQRGGIDAYAVGAAWWLGSAFFGLAAILLRQRLCGYIAIGLLPIAYGLVLEQLRPAGAFLGLAWTGLAVGLLGGAEVNVRLTGEDRWPLKATLLGAPASRSAFTSPLFAVGYLTSVLALGLTLWHGWAASAPPDDPTILALLALTALASASSILRRSSFLLFVASWLFLIPFEALVARAYMQAGQPMSAADLARLLAVLGAGYVLLGHALDRFGGHYAKALYLVGYCLSVMTIPLSSLDRAITTQVLAISIGVYALSAWWVHRRRHPAFMWVAAARHLECLFMYLACWLFPVWLLLAASLRWPTLTGADYGLVLAVLAPIYAAVGWFARGIRLDYRWPWYLAGYALSVVGSLATVGDPTARLVALTLSAALYATSCAISRRGVWLYPTLVAGLLAWVAGLFLLRPDIAASTVVATLVGPAAVMFGLACLLARTQPVKPTVEILGQAWRGRTRSWSDPLVIVGWFTLLVAVTGSAADPVAGWWTAACAAVVLALVATLWSGKVEAWLSLTMGAVACWQVMSLAGVPVVAQPPRWALAGLGLGLAEIGLRRKAWPRLAVWLQPMRYSSMAVGGAALLASVGAADWRGGSVGLQYASGTAAIAGLTLVAHGFDRDRRWLTYGGVGLLLIGYLLQLVFFEVGQLQAFTLPVGICLYAIAYLESRPREKTTPRRVKVVLEVAALATLLGVSLVQSVGLFGAGIDRYAYAGILLLESAAVFGLGAVLHWRRSFFAGALFVVLDIVILLADPLRAMNTWYLVAVIGVAMIAVVVLIEQRRQRIPFWLSAWRPRTEHWD